MMSAKALLEECVFGVVPVPSDETYRAWKCLEMRGGELRSYDLWGAVVEMGGRLRIGCLELQSPD